MQFTAIETKISQLKQQVDNLRELSCGRCENAVKATEEASLPISPSRYRI